MKGLFFAFSSSLTGTMFLQCFGVWRYPVMIPGTKMYCLNSITLMNICSQITVIKVHELNINI